MIAHIILLASGIASISLSGILFTESVRWREPWCYFYGCVMILLGIGLVMFA